MARIDHTACTHPRTPAGRTACRKSGAVAPTAKPVSIHAKTADELRIHAANEAMQLALEAHGNAITDRNADNQALLQEVLLARRPKLTRAQLASPTFQSMLP